MTKYVSQYERAREVLKVCWPHTWPKLREPEKAMMAEIMVHFALMEVRRAQPQEREDA